MVQNAQKVLLEAWRRQNKKWQPWQTHLIFHKKRTGEIVSAWKLLREGELARQRVGWSFDVFRSSRYCHRLSCAAKNLTSRHFSGCSLCFAGELNERPYPSPNLHFTQLSESKLFCMICMMYDQVGLDRVNVYFCPYISWDELKELIFALYSLSSNWCFRKVK